MKTCQNSFISIIKFAEPSKRIRLVFHFLFWSFAKARETGRVAQTNDKSDSKHRIIMAIKSPIAASLSLLLHRFETLHAHPRQQFDDAVKLPRITNLRRALMSVLIKHILIPISLDKLCAYLYTISCIFSDLSRIDSFSSLLNTFIVSMNVLKEKKKSTKDFFCTAIKHKSIIN